MKQQETNQPSAVGNSIQDKLNRELTEEASVLRVKNDADIFSRHA